ncbi:dNA polymerase III delta subunit [Firmicutes bacterium CAG:822]|nr:dNA polymerase III delta subunit [Firmicutes bacterium CAG:822]
MVYLLYGTKDFEIEEEIKKLSKGIDEMNISKYDLNNDMLSLALEDAKTMSLFGDKKLVIVDNANMFTGSTSKDSELIEEYLNHINENTTLVLIVHNDKLDTRKKITKLIKKVGKVQEFNDELDTTSLVRRLFKDYNIDYKTIQLFIDRVGNNPLIIQSEINKIKIYKDNDKNITEEDILNLTAKLIEIDIFKLIDYIVRKNKEKALELYYEMLKMNEEPIKIVVILANQFRIMYQSKELLKKGYSEKDIASTLKIHPYRVKLAIQNSRNYTSDILLKNLNALADIDIGIKTGTINKDLALELFILK